MSAIPRAPHRFAYLFERYPTFTQTFCVREVEALRRQGLEFPIFSIRRTDSEPEQDCFRGCAQAHYLPDRFDDILASDTAFRRAARRAQEDLRRLWRGDQEKKRIYEALWLGPRLAEAGVEHVHVHFAGTGARTAFWLNRLFGIRFSITAHANDIFCDEPPERLAQIFAAASVVVTVSAYSLAYLRTHYPASRDRFFRVYNGIEMDRFPVSDFPPGPPLIVSVGRYIEKKGFSTLIDACGLLGDRAAECQIVGQGPLDGALRRQVGLRGLEGRVLIAGPRCESAISDLLARSHVFALPCLNTPDGGRDNLPTVIMEAMAAGLPVVSTPVAAVPEMVDDGVTGFLVPENDPAALAEKLGRLVDDPALARKMGAAGRKRCAELFALERTSSALARILKDHDAIADCPASLLRPAA